VVLYIKGCKENIVRTLPPCFWRGEFVLFGW